MDTEKLRLTTADMDSPSYFVATAAVDLGFFKQEGLDVEYAYMTGPEGEKALLEGTVHFLGGPACNLPMTFPEWKNVKIVCALAQYAYWFLCVRKDLNAKKGDVSAVKGLRIATSLRGPGRVLEYLLRQSGVDLKRDNVRLVDTPTALGEKGWLGSSGIRAIQQGIADAYWGNGMRAELGVTCGIATVLLDIRRGDGPPRARHYNFPGLSTTERLIREQPEVAAAAVRAIIRTQKALKADPSLATEVGRRMFPPEEADLIARLIERDAPFYDPNISQEAVDGVNQLSLALGLTKQPATYDQIVAPQFRDLWKT